MAREIKEARARIEAALADVPVGSARPVEVQAADVVAVCNALTDSVAAALHDGAASVMSPLVPEVCVQEDQLRHVLRLLNPPPAPTTTPTTRGDRADV
jgi:hypothetical protein